VNSPVDQALLDALSQQPEAIRLRLLS
jgi:hypothetical protein